MLDISTGWGRTSSLIWKIEWETLWHGAPYSHSWDEDDHVYDDSDDNNDDDTLMVMVMVPDLVLIWF